jgi:hypothetical protein
MTYIIIRHICLEIQVTVLIFAEFFVCIVVNVQFFPQAMLYFIHHENN